MWSNLDLKHISGKESKIVLKNNNKWKLFASKEKDPNLIKNDI